MFFNKKQDKNKDTDPISKEQKAIDQTKPFEKLIQNEVNVKIYRPYAGKIPLAILEFKAIQKRDENFNLQLVNENVKFKEDLSVIKDKLQEQLNYRLGLVGKDRADKIQLIKSKIGSQEEIVKEIRNGGMIETEVEVKDEQGNTIKEKKRLNTIDEENKLTQYQVLLFSVENEGDSAYEFINHKGEREMYYELNDGVLYPIKYNTITKTLYPALATKKKIYRSEKDLIDKERDDALMTPFKGWKGVVMFCVFAILILSNVFWAQELNKRHVNMDSQIKKYRDMAETSALRCSYWYGKAIEEDITLLSQMAKEQVKEMPVSQETKQTTITRIDKNSE